jgi:sodium-dependent dicarboxylate transporter 2/3/5
MLALAIERWGLHQRVALLIIAAIGRSLSRLVLGFMVATGFISMWISNTATVLMMLPIGMAIVRQLGESNEHLSPDECAQLQDHFAKALLLGIAYSASIGGVATLVGTPTNAIMVSVARQELGIEVSFAWWFMLLAPVSMLLLLVCWWYLTHLAFPRCQRNNEAIQKSLQALQHKRKALGRMTYEEKSVLIVFSLTALMWIIRPLLENFIPKNHLSDTNIALIGALFLFVLPDRSGDKKLLDWATAVKLPWDVLLLFGGGFALADAFKSSGLSLWIGQQLQGFGSLPYALLLLLIIASINFLTEVTSNVATISMMLPIIIALAQSFQLPALPLMAGATCAASCAFMLPIATAPNAIVFGAGYLKVQDMVRAGVWLNIVSIIIFFIGIYLFM